MFVRTLRLVRKWINTGIIDGTDWSDAGKSAPQGAVLSPLLSNLFLHPWMKNSNSSRRDLLKSTTAGILTSGVAPAILLGADNKSGSMPKVIGPEGHRYEVYHDCMQLPDHVRWQDTHGVTVDAEGLICVKHRTKTAQVMARSSCSMPKASLSGRFLKSSTGEATGLTFARTMAKSFSIFVTTKAKLPRLH